MAEDCGLVVVGGDGRETPKRDINDEDWGGAGESTGLTTARVAGVGTLPLGEVVVAGAGVVAVGVVCGGGCWASHAFIALL